MSVQMIGHSEQHRRVLRDLESAAQSDVEVLLLGPSGVGKDLCARWLHEHSARVKRSFVPVNCGAVPTALFENELFGHVGGAFTGARPSSQGLVAEADGGTLFLDEIDALEPLAQVKLLRFLQQREYRRLGESRLRTADVRIVAASNADLGHLVREARFREDLFFRVHVFPVRIAPLRERPDDIEPLLAKFIRDCATLFGGAPIWLSDEATRHLVEYAWPGNVRELENCVRYLTSLRLERTVEIDDLRLLRESAPLAASSLPMPEAATPMSLRDAKRSVVGAFERTYVIHALQASRGNIARAARASGKPRRAFFGLMRKYGVHAEEYRGPSTAEPSQDVGAMECAGITSRNGTSPHVPPTEILID